MHIRPYTVHVNGSGQPYLHILSIPAGDLDTLGHTASRNQSREARRWRPLPTLSHVLHILSIPAGVLDTLGHTTSRNQSREAWCWHPLPGLWTEAQAQGPGARQVYQGARIVSHRGAFHGSSHQGKEREEVVVLQTLGFFKMCCRPCYVWVPSTKVQTRNCHTAEVRRI